MEYTSNEFNSLFNKDKTDDKSKFKELYDKFVLLSDELESFNQQLNTSLSDELDKNDIIKLFIDTTLHPIINDIKDFLVLIYHTKIIDNKFNPINVDDEIFKFFLDKIKN